MPLDPQIVARYWLVNWDSSTSDHEKELHSWVDDATVLLPRMIPVPCERKVGEIQEEGQILRFKVPPSRNLLYGDKYHLSLAIPSKGGRIVAEGRITNASGSQVARISVPHGAVRTNWLDGEGFDGYVAAWSAPLEAGQVYTLQLRRFDSDEEVSVWVTGFNLE